MKKTVSFISALMLVTAAFVSCEKSDDDSKASGKSKKEKPSNDLVGTWIPDEKTMESFEENLALGSTGFEKFEYVFTDTEMQLNAKMDMSKMLSVTDDSFNVYGQSFDRTYDGEVITVTDDGMTVAEFTRIDEADKDNIYGKYSNEEMSLIAEGGETYFEFPESGVSYMIMNAAQKYTYDEENSKIITLDEDGEEDDEIVVKLDGDNLTLSSEVEGELSFTRAK